MRQKVEKKINMYEMKEIVALAKNRGFIYPGSEIYGGLANTWDYGPYGVEIKNNIKKAWWHKFVQIRRDIVGLDSAILMNPNVWVASGHVGGFSDPLIDCKKCKSRFRADHLIEEYNEKNNVAMTVEALTDSEMIEYIDEKDIKCPMCGQKEFTDIRKFNLMFKTFQGVTEDSTTEIYLRPETCQGIFVDFKSIQRTSRQQVPFGVAQIGKSFRNEITPGNFIFRTREFEQMELEFFCKPGTEMQWYEYWKSYCLNWLHSFGLKEDHVRLREHSKEELSHYSSGTSDIEFLFPFGWGELWGIASRTDYDLTKHSEHSDKDLSYRDPSTNEKYIPYVVEPSLGVDRVLLAFLSDAYDVETLEDNSTRTVLRFHPMIAPVKVGILPLTKKQTELATEVFELLSNYYHCELDNKGNIGKRYRRFDEIGTPYCITVDFDTEEDNSVTVRNRDTMEQVRIKIDELKAYFEEIFRY